MRLRFQLRLTVAATLALAGAVSAQTPPQDQTPPAQSQTTPPNPADTTAAPPATAADQAPERKGATEEIVVTGSRVRRKDLTTPAPVTVISREQIQSSGIAAIGDFLQQMPEQGGATNTNVNNGGDGQTTISLRNLGAQRTLVLVDGKRWVNGGSGAGSSVDLNSIPTAAIERVEVLKDGASAVYGSDAIGGVVNLITRRRVSGVEAQAYYGASPHGDAQQTDLNITGGITGDKGSFMFNAGYFNQQSMLAANRDWATNALVYDYTSPAGTGNPTHGGSGTIPYGRARVNLDDPGCAANALCSALKANYYAAIKPNSSGNHVAYFTPGVATTANNNALVGAPLLQPCTGPVTKANFATCQTMGWRPYVSSGTSNDLYNYQAVNYLITPSQRYSLFSNGDYHINDWARAYFQGSFVNRQSSNQLAPEPLITSQFAGVYTAGNQYNPFGQDLLDVRRRLLEGSPRSQFFDLDTIRTVFGFDGTLPDATGPLSGVYWDVSFNYGRTAGTTANQGSVNTLDVTNGLGASCPPSAANCVPVNLLGGPGTITPAMVQALGGYHGVQNGWTQLVDGQANINAELVRLASDRPIGLAFGYEYRAVYGGFVPDPIGGAGLSFDYNANPTKGSYHVNEGYVELDVPIISNIVGIDDLEFQGAIRAYDYSTFGSGAIYKLGGRWRPVRDVTFRGTYQTGFRAPDVTDLYGGTGPSAEPATDPCANAVKTSAIGQRCNTVGASQGAPKGNVAGNGDTSTQINSTVGGNPQLQPEKANIGTVGVVIEPQMVRGLSVTADYYNIRVNQSLGFLTTPVILNGCYQNNNDAYCALIQRDSATGFISNVNDLEQNTSFVQTSGIDLAVRYTLPTDVGRFGFLFDGNYLIYYRQGLATGQVISAAGNYDLGSGSAISNLTPKVKFNVGVNYGLADFSFGVRGRYIGGFDECAGADGGSQSAGLCSLPSLFDASGTNVQSGGSPLTPHHVDSYIAADIFANYALRSPIGKTTFSVGMRNVADAKPPVVYNSFLTYADPAYDFVGRFIYGRITQNF